MREARGETDIRIYREALAALGERQALGLVVSEPGGRILFSSPRARRLLGAGALLLPAELQVLLEESEAPRRVHLPGTLQPVNVRTLRLPGTPRHLLITFEEEVPARFLSKSLVERFGLSARSVQLVQLVRRGLKNREIAERLRLSEATIKTYMHALFREVGVRNRAELVALAEQLDPRRAPAA